MDDTARGLRRDRRSEEDLTKFFRPSTQVLIYVSNTIGTGARMSLMAGSCTMAARRSSWARRGQRCLVEDGVRVRIGLRTMHNS